MCSFKGATFNDPDIDLINLKIHYIFTKKQLKGKTNKLKEGKFMERRTQWEILQRNILLVLYLLYRIYSLHRSS